MLFDMQIAFNAAYVGVMKQGKPAVSPEDGRCVWSAPDGCRCAVSHALLAFNRDVAIDAFTEVCEDIGVSVFDGSREGQFISDIRKAHDEGAKWARTSHDAIAFTSFYDTRMREIAKRFGLTVPEVN